MSSGKVYAFAGNKGFVVTLTHDGDILPIEDVTVLNYLMIILGYEGVPANQSKHVFQTAHAFARYDGSMFLVQPGDVFEIKMVDLSPVLPKNFCFN